MNKETSSLPEFVNIKKIIKENARVTSFYFQKKLESKPGQFIMVWVPGVGERPFSLFEDKKGFMISVAKVGKVTEAMHQLKVGDRVGIRGPYGSHFTLPSKKGELVMVAGGYGIVPLAYLAAVAKKEGYKVTMLKGSRTSEDELYHNLLLRHKIKSFAATDDGTLGRKGFVHELFWDYLQNKNVEMIYICGPEIMEYQMAKLCWKHHIQFQVSVERYIKCGIGLCGICHVDTTGWRICKEGPIFSGEKLKLIKEFGKYRRNPSGAVEKYLEHYKYALSDTQIIKFTQKKREELLQSLSHSSFLIDNVTVLGDGRKKISVTDPSKLEDEQKRTGDYFVSFPKSLAHVLPGNSMAPDDFLHALDTTFKNAGLLLQSRNKQTSKKKLFYQTNGLRLTIYNPSFNPQAIWITEIAARLNAFNSQHNRAEYQSHLFEVVKPILKEKSAYDVRVVEDCIATADTIIGVLVLLLQKNKATVGQRRIRIDAIVASVQSILILHAFAKENKFKLELNIGYAAYGLTEGQKIDNDEVHVHANYLVYPEVIFQKLPNVLEKLTGFRAFDGHIYVVGNMGDAAQSMEKRFDVLCPWNRFRDDGYGARKTGTIKPVQSNPKRPTSIFIANGGYLMKAFYALVNRHSTDNRIIVRASSIWAKEKRYGYGVLITFI